MAGPETLGRRNHKSNEQTGLCRFGSCTCVMSDKNETVKVVVRIRPMSSEDTRNGNQVASEAMPDRGQIVVRNPKTNDRYA